MSWRRWNGKVQGRRPAPGPEMARHVGFSAALGREVVACQPPADRTAAPSRSAPRFPSARTENDLDFLAPLSLYVPPLLAAEEEMMTERAVELLRAAADVVQALADPLEG